MYISAENVTNIGSECSSTQTTLRYYEPFVKARQDQLDSSVRAVGR